MRGYRKLTQSEEETVKALIPRANKIKLEGYLIETLEQIATHIYLTAVVRCISEDNEYLGEYRVAIANVLVTPDKWYKIAAVVDAFVFETGTKHLTHRRSGDRLVKANSEAEYYMKNQVKEYRFPLKDTATGDIVQRIRDGLVRRGISEFGYKQIRKMVMEAKAEYVAVRYTYNETFQIRYRGEDSYYITATRKA